MEVFYAGLAEILEIDTDKVGPGLDLSKLAWDSLAVISTIALVDEHFGVMLDGKSLAQCQRVGDIEALIAKKKG